MTKLEEKLIELGYEEIYPNYEKEVGDNTIVIDLNWTNDKITDASIRLYMDCVYLDSVEQHIINLRKTEKVLKHDLEVLENVE